MANKEFTVAQNIRRSSKAFFVTAGYRPPRSAVDNPSFEALREVSRGLYQKTRRSYLWATQTMISKAM